MSRPVRAILISALVIFAAVSFAWAKTSPAPAAPAKASLSPDPALTSCSTPAGTTTLRNTTRVVQVATAKPSSTIGECFFGTKRVTIYGYRAIFAPPSNPAGVHSQERLAIVVTGPYTGPTSAIPTG